MVTIDFGVSEYGRRSPNVPREEVEASRKIIVPEEGTLASVTLVELRCVGLDWFTSTFDEYIQGTEKYRALRDWYDSMLKGAEIKGVGDWPSAKSLTLSRKSGGDIGQLLLFWIKERKEWVGISRNRGYGCDAYACGEDDSFEGPFALDNDRYGRKLLEAYGISEGVLSPGDALHTGPSDLEKLATPKRIQ